MSAIDRAQARLDHRLQRLLAGDVGHVLRDGRRKNSARSAIRVTAPVVLGPQRAGQEHVAPERLDVDTGEAREHLVVRRRVRADQVRVTGDVEVLAAAGGVDLGEDPHPQPGQQRAHLLDVAAVVRVDVDHRDQHAGVEAQGVPVLLESREPGLVVAGVQGGPALGADELGSLRPPPLAADPDRDTVQRREAARNSCSFSPNAGRGSQ